MPRFRPSLPLILVCTGFLSGCGNETTNTDEVGESGTGSDDGSTSETTDESTSESDGSTSDSETTDGSTSDSETTDESTSESETTDESTDESETGDPICGDAMVDEGEECDDGNDVDDDACTNACTFPPGFLIELSNPAVELDLVDDGYNGMQSSMTCSLLSVPDSGTVIGVTATFAITHTFSGDVTAKLISPTGTIVTMFSRPGLNDMGDNGTGCCGETANLDAASPLRFADEFVADPETMGGPLATNQIICLDDMICDYATNPGSAAPGTMADFIGESVTGNWTFCASDAGGGDTGSLVGIAISIEAVD